MTTVNAPPLPNDLFRKIEVKHRPVVGDSLRGDGAPVVFGNFFTDGQSDTCSTVFTAAMKPLKHFENLMAVFGFEPDTVVGERDVME